MARFPNRFLHLSEAPGNVDDYRLFRMEGSEGLSEPFTFNLTIRSQDAIPKAEAWIGASITFSWGQVDNAERKLNGRCAEFRHLHEKGRYVEFAIKVTPAFDALKLTRDRRIFNDRSNKDVIEAVLAEHQVSFDTAKYGSSPKKAYIVQHDESDFTLVSRLMEDEGVFYYFRFDEGAAPYKHRMILAGDPAGYYDGEPFDLAFRRDHMERGLSNLSMGYAGAPAKVVTHDYNFRQPGSLTPITAPSKVNWAEKKGHVFQYGAGYQEPGRGEQRAELCVQDTESGAVTLRGQGTYAAFAPGARFNVQDTQLQPWERRIVVRRVQHAAFDPYAADEGEPFYHQTFEAHPSAQVFRPQRSTPAAVAHGPQTALVLDQNDPEGLGRVKVRYHWDHTGHSSCWVRVLQQWSGDGAIGAQWIPRPGTEVLVGFIENRVELPYLMGCFYNGKQKPVFDLPANLTQSGWRTSGPAGLAHHLYFEDKGGKEAIDLQSGRDFVRNVARNETAEIKEQLATAAKAIDIAATESIAIHVGASRITITPQGVWIDAPKIHLNDGDAPTTFTPAIQPPAPDKTSAGAQAGGGVASGGGAAPGTNRSGSGGGPATTGGQPAAPPSPQAQALARSLTKPGGSATQADADVVSRELAKLPEPALQALAKNNVQVIAAKGSVTDYATELKNVQPRGWPPGKTWDDVPGAYLPGKNQVVIATTGAGSSLHVPQTGEGHGSVNMVVHEATHAIDQHIGGSTDATFLAARTSDLSALPAYEGLSNIGGASETYAESAARFYGGSHGSVVTPALDSYWRAHPLGGK